MPADSQPSTSKSENTLLKSNEMLASKTQSSGSSIPDWLMKKLVSTNNAATQPRKQRAPVTPPTTQIPLYPTSMNVQRPGGQLASFGMLSPHYYTRAPQFLSRFIVGSVLLIFYFFCVILLCVFTFWVSCCDVRYDFRMNTMFDSSLPSVVCRRSNVLFMLFVFVCA